jgi:type I pantothenate kinase
MVAEGREGEALFAPAPGDPADTYRRVARRVAARARAGTPFLLGVAGAVAAGKTTAADRLADLLRDGPGAPSVEVISSDGFLYSNEQLAAAGLTNRKGFPDSFDTPALIDALVSLRAGRPTRIPRYSHLHYDVTPAVVVEAPDVVVLEGINLLQVHPAGAPILVSDLLDLAVYLDATEADLRRWFSDRLAALFREAAGDPSSYYHQWSGWSAAQIAGLADAAWEGVNAQNLRHYIAPSRWRADIIIEQDGEHGVRGVLERRK